MWTRENTLLLTDFNKKVIFMILHFSLDWFWWTTKPFFVYILLCRPSEDSPKWSTVPDGRPSQDWQSTEGWGYCWIRTQECRFTIWCRYHWATTTPLSHHYCNRQWEQRADKHSFISTTQRLCTVKIYSKISAKAHSFVLRTPLRRTLSFDVHIWRKRTLSIRVIVKVAKIHFVLISKAQRLISQT